MTQNAKHTPGPWKIIGYSEYEAHFEQYQVIAEIEGDGYLVAGRSALGNRLHDVMVPV